MPATLHFTTGAWSGRVIAIREPETRIGRDPELDVVVPPEDQRFVSRAHAVITKTGGQYIARDLESSNGTLVNGSLITQRLLADGDEIQFGRHGPIARFRCEAARTDTVLETDAVTAPLPRREPPPRREPSPRKEPPPRREPPPSPPLPVRAEAPSQIVRRIVHEAIAVNLQRSRRRIAIVLITIAVGAAGAGLVMVRSGVFENAETAFGRLADRYQGRVVLVEVGVKYRGAYTRLGNGTGFFADAGGLIVTNKHVIHSDRYISDSACLAESFRRRGLSYEKALVVSVWPGGSQFRQTSTEGDGDRGLGYSTDLGTLSLVAVAADTLLPPVDIQCRDRLGGAPFTYSWRPHASDNHDLAIMRASKAVDPIPLAEGEPKADDDVMVLGFPTGTVPLETNKAEPIRRIGNVLRTRDTIQIDAVVLGGNSGGPLIDRSGNVVGVTTRGPAESLNMAIKVEHVRRLLERAK